MKRDDLCGRNSLLSDNRRLLVILCQSSITNCLIGPLPPAARNPFDYIYLSNGHLSHFCSELLGEDRYIGIGGILSFSFSSTEVLR